MADSQTDLCPNLGVDTPSSTSLPEGVLLREWDRDIKRAARAAANGGGGDEHDLAQQARARLVTASRGFPQAPLPYLRAVVANAMRSALRYEFRRSQIHVAPVEGVDEELAAPNDQPLEERAQAVRAWVARLPIQFREIYRHIYMEDRSQRETAKLLGISQPRVAQLHRQLLQRGREELAYLVT